MPITLSTFDALEAAQLTDLRLLSHIRPFIFGNKALLHRFAQADEKVDIFVGYYDPDIDQTYELPGKLAGSIVDTGYTRVFIENALLNYFNDYRGSGQTIAPVSGYPNRVRSATIAFKTANGTSRSAGFYDRDVAVGDLIYVRGTVSATTYEHWSTVSGLVAEEVAASIASATSDANNRNTQGASTSISQVAGTPANDVVAVATGTAYNSLADGYITRTYTITVMQGSTGGDATTALLRVRSADGGDDADNVVPAAFASPTAIGAKGLTVTFSVDPDEFSDSTGSGIDQDDFLVGQQWTVTVNQAFTKPTPTSGGTYVGATNTTYIVRVSRGGLYAASNKPQITVSTTTGVDVSGPTDVSAADTFVAIGTQGATMKFSVTAGLRAGDIYYAAATAVSEGAVRTLELTNALPAGLLTATDLDLRLFIKVPSVEVSENRSQPDVGINWSADEDSVTVEAGLQLTTTGLTDGGAARYVPVVSGNGNGKVYIEYREWDISQAGTLYRISSRADVEETLGIVDPDNPIAFAVDVALQNTAGDVLTSPNTDAAANSDVIICAVLGGAPTDADQWTDILELVANEEQIYNLVPLTTDETIQDLVAAHVAAQSSVEVPNYRACLLPASVQEQLAIAYADTSSDEEVILATLGQDPDESGDAFTYLNVPLNNGNFITNGVRAGDTVRYEYTLGDLGEEAWTEYTVEDVVSESTLRLVAGADAAIATPQRVEVWRSPTKDELVTQLTDRAAELANKRVCLVWPDQATAGGVAVSGYYVCAAIAGLAGSVSSHQGLRNVEILGFDSLPRSRTFFRTQHLDNLKAGGVFVCSTTLEGVNYVRWAVTTDPTDVNTREEMVRRNLDLFTLALLKDDWGDLIGSANVTEYLLSLMKTKFRAYIDRLSRTTRSGRLGSVVLEATLTSINAHPTLLDRVQAAISFTGPYPDNQNDLTVTI